MKERKGRRGEGEGLEKGGMGFPEANAFCMTIPSDGNPFPHLLPIWVWLWPPQTHLIVSLKEPLRAIYMYPQRCNVTVLKHTQLSL
jgi:hypothetical protein